MDRDNQRTSAFYCLSDYLEMNFSSDTGKARKLVKALVGKKKKNNQVFEWRCIAYGHQLIVINSGKSKSIRKLHLLHAESQRVDLYHVKSRREVSS